MSAGVTRLTLLGTGSSGGVPRANGDWGLCDSANPRNRRLRCSALVEHAADIAALQDAEAVTRIVIDTSPDFREQMLSCNVKRLDAALLTHDHADQTHGMDDLRAFAISQRQRIPVWIDAPTWKTVGTRFGYAFTAPEGSFYPAILEKRDINAAGQALVVEGPGGPVHLTAFAQQHGPIMSLGYRIGNLAYSADISALPDDSAAILNGIGCWVVDALRQEPHPTHFSVPDALAALERVEALQGVLTNLHNTLDHAALSAALPDRVLAAFDGLSILDDGNSVTIEG